MEENKELDAGSTMSSDASKEQCENASAARTIESAPKSVRRNGRNNSGHKQATVKAEAENSSCGEITGFSGFSEKLSGSNVNGYSEGQGFSEKRRERGERFGKRDEANASEASSSEPEQASVASNESVAEPVENASEAVEQHDGPHFEVSETRNTAIDTPLVDKRSRDFNSDKRREKGVVSYTAESEATSVRKVGLFGRIKAMISSIFGKKSEQPKSRGGRDFDRNRRGGKNWKNERRFNDHHNRHGKGPYNNNGRKPYRNDRRPDGSSRGSYRGGQNGGAPQA